ncbi:MAG: hypothetical protein RBT67_15390 [Thauera sp.]|jgi:hypothetical protein|nr:hypothetical protein [Thauera sp.]
MQLPAHHSPKAGGTKGAASQPTPFELGHTPYHHPPGTAQIPEHAKNMIHFNQKNQDEIKDRTNAALKKLNGFSRRVFTSRLDFL